MRSNRLRRRVAFGIVVVVTLPFLWRWGGGNFGTITLGRLYRSGQLSAGGLSRTVRSYGIKTVVNLRGSNPDQVWYRDERNATLAAGAVQVDVPIASDQWLSREQARGLVRVLDSVETPALIHCEWGAERTGLASAIATLLRPGSTVEEARRQFSTYYLFLNRKDGRVMYGHLLQYERWLASHDEGHSPERFRHWIASEYRPEGNSRQLWPCNPYPLRVVSRRGPDGGMRVETEWSPERCPPHVAEGPSIRR